MLEETPEGVPNPCHPQTQDRHRKGAQGGVRGPLTKGEFFRVRTNLWRETKLASSFSRIFFIIADNFFDGSQMISITKTGLNCISRTSHLVFRDMLKLFLINRILSF
jgi:hypothetical protein